MMFQGRLSSGVADGKDGCGRKKGTYDMDRGWRQRRQSSREAVGDGGDGGDNGDNGLGNSGSERSTTDRLFKESNGSYVIRLMQMNAEFEIERYIRAAVFTRGPSCCSPERTFPR